MAFGIRGSSLILVRDLFEEVTRYVISVFGNALREEQTKVLNVTNRESSQHLLPSDLLLGYGSGTPFRIFSATDPIVRGK